MKHRREWRGWLVWLVVAMPCACGDDDFQGKPGNPTPTSGARLKLRAIEFDDGAHQYTGLFFDALRDEPCAPTNWTDGRRRCTPPSVGVLFTDAQCSSPIGEHLGDMEPPRLLEMDEWDTSSMEFRVSKMFARGPEVSAPASLYLRNIQGSCVQRPGGSAPRYFQLGKQLSPADLVELSELTVALDDRLAARLWTSRDGLRWPVGLYDRALDTDCELDNFRGDTFECHPRPSGFVDYYADASCTQPIAIATTPTGYAEREDAGCRSYYPIGSPRSSQVAYALWDGMCEVAQLQGGYESFDVGEPLVLATVPRARTPGGTRLESIWDGPLVDRYMFDTELGTECYFSGATDVCRPRTADPIALAYTDASCTAAVTVASVPTSTCAAPVAYATATGGVAPLRPADGTALYTRDTSCVPLIAGEGYEYRILDDTLVPDSAMVAGHAIVE